MDNTAWQTIYAVSGALIAVLTLIGLAVRFVLVPYLRETIVKPLHQVRTQVTINGNTHKPPTVPDRVEDAKDTIMEELKRVHDEVIALSNMFDGHLEWSQREVDRLEKKFQRKIRRDGS